MAAPFTVVTFVDQDGDEFPIRVEGLPIEEQAMPEASRILEGFIMRDEMDPNEPMVSYHIERLGLDTTNGRGNSDGSTDHRHS